MADSVGVAIAVVILAAVVLFVTRPWEWTRRDWRGCLLILLVPVALLALGGAIGVASLLVDLIGIDWRIPKAAMLLVAGPTLFVIGLIWLRYIFVQEWLERHSEIRDRHAVYWWFLPVLALMGGPGLFWVGAQAILGE